MSIDIPKWPEPPSRGRSLREAEPIPALARNSERAHTSSGAFGFQRRAAMQLGAFFW